jgi:hypothetical protein
VNVFTDYIIHQSVGVGQPHEMVLHLAVPVALSSTEQLTDFTFVTLEDTEENVNKRTSGSEQKATRIKCK